MTKTITILDQFLSLAEVTGKTFRDGVSIIAVTLRNREYLDKDGLKQPFVSFWGYVAGVKARFAVWSDSPICQLPTVSNKGMLEAVMAQGKDWKDPQNQVIPTYSVARLGQGPVIHTGFQELQTLADKMEARANATTQIFVEVCEGRGAIYNDMRNQMVSIMATVQATTKPIFREFDSENGVAGEKVRLLINYNVLASKIKGELDLAGGLLMGDLVVQKMDSAWEIRESGRVVETVAQARIVAGGFGKTEAEATAAFKGKVTPQMEDGADQTPDPEF